MLDEKEIRTRILSKATEMFLQFGYSKVTMEEIAEEVGVSKKTLYKFFTGKEGLIKETIEHLHCDTDVHLDQIWNSPDLDFVAKLKKVLDFIGTQNSKYNKHFLLDIQKNMPELWEEIRIFQRQKMIKKISGLFNEGVKNGVFREDIDQRFVIMIHIYAIQGMMNADLFEEHDYTPKDIFEKTIKILLEGIMTEEGRSKYLSYNSEDKE